MKNKPKDNQLVVHVRTGGNYRVFRTDSQMKVNGAWVPSVLYFSVDRVSDIFCRDLSAFMDNFEEKAS